MRNDQFILQAELEDNHWWFNVRRVILKDQIIKYQPDSKIIAEIGCGTGGNLRTFSQMGAQVIGVDINPEATRLAQARVSGRIYTGDFEAAFGNDWGRIDVIVLADVLEHVKEDHHFFSKVIRCMRPGAIIVLTVPALPLLWSEHDIVLGHQRRYLRRQLVKIFKETSGIECVRLTYFNSILFPFIAITRLFKRIVVTRRMTMQSDLIRHGYIINTILQALFSIEIPLLKLGNSFPVGASLIAVIRKN